MKCKQRNNDPNYNVIVFFGLKVLDGMLFRGSLPLKLNWDLQQWIRLCLIIRMNLVCTVFFYKFFDVYCLHKFSKYIPYKLSIEKQRSFGDA